MRASKGWLSAVLLTILGFTAFAQAPRFVVVRKSQAGVIGYEPVEVFTINGRDRIRTLEGSAVTVAPAAYNKAAKLLLSQAGVVRQDSAQRFVLISGQRDGRVYIVPDQLKPKVASNVEDLWKNIRFASRKTKKTKQETAFGSWEFFALIPATSPASAAAAFVLDAAHFDGVDERLAAILGLTQSFPNAPELDAVRAFLNQRMQEGFEALEAGGPYPDFLETVRFAELSQKTFPNVRSLAELNKDIMQKKSWVETTLRTLRSLYNNNNWDDFIQRYVSFERYQASFGQMMDSRRRAFTESARVHVQIGGELRKQKKYVESLRELRLALSRDPLNDPLRTVVEDARIEASLALALQKAPLRQPLKQGSPLEVRFTRNLRFADLYIRDRKFTEAETEIRAAEELDKDSPSVLLVRAKYHQGRNELAQALALLDTYDESVAEPEERRLGEEVRTTIMYDLKKLKAEHKAEIEKLYADGRYSDALQFVTRSQDLDRGDEDFLFSSGILAAILRKPEMAIAKLQGYLEASNSLNGDFKRRDRALRVLAVLQSPRPLSTTGSPNWFSGRKLAPAMPYCPESLVFQQRIDRIEAHKLDIVFEWAADGKLKSVVSRFKDDGALREFLARRTAAAPAGTDGFTSVDAGNFHFDYLRDSPQMLRVARARATDPAAASGDVRGFKISGGMRVSVGEPKEPSRTRSAWQYITLLSSPVLNTDVLSQLEGPVTVGFSGNPYFNPFVWDDLHMFWLSYDKLARVESAREIGTNRILRFEWDGDRLLSITAYTSESQKRGQAVYRRVMNYTANRLVSESVESGGKTGKILYKYQGAKLVEAALDDNAHDGRSRQIRFRD